MGASQTLAVLHHPGVSKHAKVQVRAGAVAAQGALR
jgi:hypothetical protein